jgi:hypothetical protein
LVTLETWENPGAFALWVRRVAVTVRRVTVRVRRVTVRVHGTELGMGTVAFDPSPFCWGAVEVAVDQT